MSGATFWVLAKVTALIYLKHGIHIPNNPPAVIGGGGGIVPSGGRSWPGRMPASPARQPTGQAGASQPGRASQPGSFGTTLGSRTHFPLKFKCNLAIVLIGFRAKLPGMVRKRFRNVPKGVIMGLILIGFRVKYTKL